MNILAKDGRCKTFDHLADGFGRAEACAALFLSLSSKGSRNLRLSTSSHSGRGKGLGAVKKESLASELEKHLKSCKNLEFFVPHGNGHPDSDLLEIQALGDADDSLVVVSTFKHVSNHAEAASGLLSLLGFLEALDFGEIPGHPTLTKINNRIGANFLESTKTCIPIEKIDCKSILTAGIVVSSIAFGGSFSFVSLDWERHPFVQQKENSVTICVDSKLDLKSVAARFVEDFKEGRFNAVFDFCFRRDFRCKMRFFAFGADIATLRQSIEHHLIENVNPFSSNDDGLLIAAALKDSRVSKLLSNFLTQNGIRCDLMFLREDEFRNNMNFGGKLVLFYVRSIIFTLCCSMHVRRKCSKEQVLFSTSSKRYFRSRIRDSCRENQYISSLF